MIEKVTKFSTRLHSGEEVELEIVLEFDDGNLQPIIEWASRERIIAMQRWLRSLSRDEAVALNGARIPAEEAGKKIESPASKVAKAIKVLESLGMSDEAERLRKRLKK